MMKILILVLTVVALCTSEDVDHKKRGVQKGSTVNSLNTHQKPDTVGRNYPQKTQDKQQNHHQRPSTITVLQQNPQQEVAVQQQVDQQVYALPPQIVPIHFVPQPVYQQPRYQILASRHPSGQMQLTLIPHNVFMNLVYGSYNAPSAQGQVHQQQEVAPTAPPTAETAYNNYVTQSPLVYSQQSQVPAGETSYYSNQQVPVQYVYSSSAQAAQPVTYSQQAPTYSQQTPTYSQQTPTYSQQTPTYSQQTTTYSQQVPAYSQNYITPSVTNSVYSSPYYQNGYQTKYQYTNNNAYEQNQSYETIPQTEYEKPASHQIHKNDVSSHTNQYLAPPDTHFRPIHVYHRGPSHYRS